MPNNLAVTLDESTTPWSVAVDEHGNANEVSRNPNSQTITWKLESNAATGTIVNFGWLTNPPPADNILGPFTIGPNGKQATMSDLNNSVATTGSWIYQLTINVGGTNYTTITALKVGTNTNPNIKNN
ncbi:MAG: hypothetical protein ACLPQ6_02740 [Steroidobacteraceae bacterium]|jgi:hypothetical protein